MFELFTLSHKLKFLSERKIIVQTGGIQAQFRSQHIGGLFIKINKL
jgi:hypothetical protein